jgi:hypothetical protein
VWQPGSNGFAHLVVVEFEEQLLPKAVETAKHPTEVLDAVGPAVDRDLQAKGVLRHGFWK